jgi:tRNA pseudouridine38-40 synthase
VDESPQNQDFVALGPECRYKRGLLLTLAYDGSAFCGFVPQHNAVTVGHVLAAAIRKFDPEASALRVASRTDSGVHARGQCAAFDSRLAIPTRGWMMGLAAHLPPQIAVQRVAEVPIGFSPSNAAIGKVYRYRVLRGALRDPFLAGRAWRVHDKLNVDLMRQEAEALLGTHDFAAFRGAQDARLDTVRRIDRAHLFEVEHEPRCLIFEIEGNRFMFRMVRIIVGTLVDVGRGLRAPGAIKRAIESRERMDLGITAPADGLCLEQVHLRETGCNAWPEDNPRRAR